MTDEKKKADTDTLDKWLRLHLADQVGAVTFGKLLRYFGDIDKVLAATPGQLSSVPGIGLKTARRIAASRDAVDAHAERRLAERLGVRILTLADETYPAALKQIHDPPPVLYVKGTLRRQDQLAIAIVGSRHASQYGIEQASRLAHVLAAAGFTIVSGLARGIDTAAHRGALAAGGRTFAVQGCGLARVYPTENTELAGQIAANGALISELPLRFEPLATTFPMRNRIISGLSLATIVVEARPRSGALITARLALEQNREVMAVPGRIDAPGSAGPHRLIKDGATLVERIEDVLDALGPVGNILEEHVRTTETRIERQTEASSRGHRDTLLASLSETEQDVFSQLDTQPVHIDALAERLAMPTGRLNATLTHLQLKGLVRQLPGGYFRRRGE